MIVFPVAKRPPRVADVASGVRARTPNARRPFRRKKALPECHASHRSAVFSIAKLAPSRKMAKKSKKAAPEEEAPKKKGKKKAAAKK